MSSDLESLYSLAGLRSDRARNLSDATFRGVRFDRLLIGPGTPPDALVHVSRCKFRDCSVAGEFRVAPGVVLEDVIFDRMSSRDSFTINTQVILKNVVVCGAPKFGGLWVKPADLADSMRRSALQDWVDSARDGIDLMLDFSGFEAEETEVIGLPLSKLKWNHDKHVPVKLGWKDLDEWKRLNFPLTSFWSLSIRRLQSFHASEGVFALPSPSNRKYAQAMDEMSRLIESGILLKPA